MASLHGMAQGQNGATKPRPNKGDILIVIHDFVARGDDELTLKRGDRVRLTERDDDFGDGWYLGEHLGNGTSGLFPEVYTQLPQTPASNFTPTSQGMPQIPVASAPGNPYVQNSVQPEANGGTVRQNGITRSVSVPGADVYQPTRSSAPQQPPDLSNSNGTTRLSSGRLEVTKQPSLPTLPPSNTAVPGLSRAITSIPAAPLSPDSAVMNETLSVIDEHITDMNGVRGGASMGRKHGIEYTNDYGSLADHHRLSYINGEETDEEEEVMPTKAEVLAWSPDQVAEYLFTTGVEAKHCEVLRSEEFSGEVILGMEQETLQMGTLDLGPIGRRLKTWHKIKALQDGVAASTRRNTGNYGSEHGSENASRRGSRNTAASIPRISSLMERPGSRQNSTRYSQQQSYRMGDVLSESPISPMNSRTSPQMGGAEIRPSAAVVREMQHSRQNSDGNAFGFAQLAQIDEPVQLPATQPPTDTAHKKNPSFDRNWTMGVARSIAPVIPSRPMSSGLNIGTHFLTEEPLYHNNHAPGSDLDRGYFSGGEAETRNRNYLKKRASNSHSRNSSYTEEQRNRTATANIRHSRIGSVDSIRENPVSAAQKYYGTNGRRRTPSESSINPTLRPMPIAKDAPSPTTTKLEATTPYPDSASAKSPASLTPQNGPADWSMSSKSTSASRFGGLRAISDAVTGHERSKLKTPNTDSTPGSAKDSPLQSPSQAGTEGSTPSGEPSFDLGSPEAKLGSSQSGPTRTRRKKSKKETSAYTRGLLPLSFAEQKANADYYGWMKKKSSNLMTTWKWRLCILKHRRLSYYYSEEDTEEKGLIDISFHRVLPADGDKVTNLHAALTGATNGPTSPPNTIAPSIASAMDDGTKQKSAEGEPMFIFKLVPPRAGLSRAVTFTKPTVHYFAVENVQQGRLWMAALMKATIDRDDTTPITTTYQQKTISLNKARMMRHRPPALMNLEENPDGEVLKTPASDKSGLNITGVIYDTRHTNEEDSGVSGFTKSDTNTELNKVDSVVVDTSQEEANRDKDMVVPTSAVTPNPAIA